MLINSNVKLINLYENNKVIHYKTKHIKVFIIND